MNEIERARIIHDDQGDSYQNRKGIGTNLGAPMVTVDTVITVKQHFD